MTQIIQFHPTSLTTSGTTRIGSLPNPPTPGNTVVVLAFFDKNKTVNTPPAGFTQRISNAGDNGQLTVWAGDRVAQSGDGASVQFIINSSTNSATRILMWELEGPVTFGGGSYDYNDAPTLPEISTGSTGALASTAGLAIAVAGADSSPAWFNGSGHHWTNDYMLEAYDFTDPAGNSGIPAYAVGYKTLGINSAGESATFQYTENPTYQEDQMAAAILVYLDQVTAAVLSSPTPSGTLTTQGQATIGATTTQNTGTLYTVIATSAAALSGITAAQIIAGQVASGAAAPFSGNSAISSTSPSVTVTGLSASTTYYSATVQANANGNSNIVTSSFTTAAASRGVQVTLKSRATGLLNGVTLRFHTRYTLQGAAIDGGADGLPFTCNSAGVFTLYGLTINAGAGWVTTTDPADPTKSINIPVTFASAV